ncbi:MAG: metallophosphoesterase [Cyanobacteria bacterium J06642_12]
MKRFWQMGLAIASITVGISVGAMAARVDRYSVTEQFSVPGHPAFDSAIDLEDATELPAQPLPPETEAIVSSVSEGMYDPPRGDVRIVVTSDLNSAYGSTDYDSDVDRGIALIPFWGPDLVLISGDMVAGQSPSLSPEQIRAMWAAFDSHIAAPLRDRNIPLGFSLGNHDASSARTAAGGFTFQIERDLAAEYWNSPDRSTNLTFVDRDDFPFYYTFEQQGVFFLVWDGSSSYIPPDKLAWVEQALSSPAAQNARLRIVISHLPLYSVAEGRNAPGEVMGNADQLRQLLERHSVHTYISGHQHAYYPGHRGALQLLHTGILGSGPRVLIDSTLPPRKTMTVVDIAFDNPDFTTYTTYDMDTLQPIDSDGLPRLLVGHNGDVLRRDIELSDLTTAEQSLCQQRLGTQCGF